MIMNISFFRIAFIMIVVAAVVFSCKPEHLRGYKKTKSGLFYKFHERNPDSAKVSINDILTVEMTYKVRDTVIFNSKDIKRPMQFPLTASIFRGDFYEGIAMMHKGDSASFQCPADSVVLKILKAKRVPEFIKPGEMMLINVRLKNFYTPEQFNIEKKKFLEEMKIRGNMLLSIYKQENNVVVEPEESGLVVIHLQKGNGKTPARGQKVKLHYMGTFTDGTKFDSSYERDEPFEFTIGMNEVVPGFEEGIQKMRVGGKARFVLPGDIAYGERNVGIIPPHTPLIFEVELLEILN